MRSAFIVLGLALSVLAAPLAGTDSNGVVARHPYSPESPEYLHRRAFRGGFHGHKGGNGGAGAGTTTTTAAAATTTTAAAVTTTAAAATTTTAAAASTTVNVLAAASAAASLTAADLATFEAAEAAEKADPSEANDQALVNAQLALDQENQANRAAEDAAGLTITNSNGE